MRMPESSRRIHGKTWDVYLCVLTSKEPVGVREIWRQLGLSSPSLAQYHVNKLLDLKLIQPSSGGYAPTPDQQLEALKSFLVLRGRLVPRFVIYGAFILGILASYILFWPFRWDFRDLATLAFGAFSAGAFFFEAYRQQRGLRVDEERS